MRTAQARQAGVRRLQLEIVVRLRRLGPLPWVLLLAWMLIAQAQEPKALRSFGIAIGPQAAWVGASIVLPFLITSKRIHGPRAWSTDLLTNVMLLFAVALGQAWLALLVESAIAGHAAPAIAMRSTLCFVLAWLPLACSAAGNVLVDSRGGFASWARVAIMLTAASLGVGFGAHAWQRGYTPELLAAVTLASLAGLLASTMQTNPSSCGKCA